MKILVTGGAGFIGSHVVNYCIRQGIPPSDIFVFDNLSCGHLTFIPDNVNFIEGDLLNKDDINNLFLNNSIDLVMHFASYISVHESILNPSKYFENNVLGGLNLLEAMLKGGCNKIIVSSTAAVYGESDKIMSENFFTNPINPYGASKLMFENIVHDYAKLFNIRAIIFRYFNASGAAYNIGEWHEPETHLVPLLLRAVKEKEKGFCVFGNDYNTYDGTCVRDYVHVLDLASAHYLAVNYLMSGIGGGVECFNLGTGHGVSIREVIEIVKRMIGSDFVVIEKERRLGDAPFLVADPKKAYNLLNWKAVFNMEDIIRSAWEWEKNR